MLAPAPTTTTALSVRGLTVNYGTGVILDELDVKIPCGSFAGIVGANGSGKSTLLQACLGLLPKATREQAQVEFFGKPLRAIRTDLGYMPQSQQVDWDFPATVLDVALMGRTASKRWWWPWPNSADKKAARQAVAAVGLQKYSGAAIGALSGGQRQRALLARTLVNSPELLVLDEPFQGIDAFSQETIVDILRELHQSGTTIIMVHHNLAEVAEYCDHVTLLANGKVSANGPTHKTLTDTAISDAYNLPGNFSANLTRDRRSVS